MRTCWLWVALPVLMACGAAEEPARTASEPAESRSLLRLEELSFTDIDRLDRERTVFFLTFGNLEEHGPHLPVGSDFYLALGVRDGVVERLERAYPDYAFVAMPVVPLGEGGANDVAHEFDHVGTYGVRYRTLRDVAVDLGSAIARQGFRIILLIHSHGMPLHNLALSDAARFVSERYGVRMVNVTSLAYGEGFPSAELLEEHLGVGWEERVGVELHAGAAETSLNLHFRGDLVKPDYARYTLFFAADLAQFLRTHEGTQGWRGYWGDPSLASPDLGAALAEDLIARSYRIADRVLRGDNLSDLVAYPGALLDLPEAQSLMALLLQRYARQAREFQDWLSAGSGDAGSAPGVR